MASLQQYVGPNETVHLRYRQSIQYLAFRLVFVAGVLYGLAHFFNMDKFFVGMILMIWGTYASYEIFEWWTTIYFATESKVYAKWGILRVKVTAAQKSQITDIVVRQGFLEKFFFNKGTLWFDTAGTPEFEIIQKHVYNPFQKRKLIEAVLTGRL